MTYSDLGKQVAADTKKRFGPLGWTAIGLEIRRAMIDSAILSTMMTDPDLRDRVSEMRIAALPIAEDVR
jgi:hypothetical protein